MESCYKSKAYNHGNSMDGGGVIAVKRLLLVARLLRTGGAVSVREFSTTAVVFEIMHWVINS